MIFTYNKEHVGDALMVIVKNSGDAKLDVERKGKVARVFLKDNGETVAWNIFEVSSLFEIEETNPEFTFIRVDRDQYMDLAKLWDVYGIPSLVVLEKDKEIGRFVNRDRKSKQQINDFLAGLK